MNEEKKIYPIYIVGAGPAGMTAAIYLKRANIEFKIVDKYGIKYWDYINSDRFTIDDFYDMEHLNRKGALKFTTMLNDSINTMKSKP